MSTRKRSRPANPESGRSVHDGAEPDDLSRPARQDRGRPRRRAVDDPGPNRALARDLIAHPTGAIGLPAQAHSMAEVATPEATARATPTLRDDAKAMFRQAVLDAAEGVLATQGFHQARIQDIAKAARVSVGTIYNHFTQKEYIVEALLNERWLQILEAFRDDEDDPPDFVGRFRALLGRILAVISQHQAFFRFALHEGFLEPDVAPKWSTLAIRATAYQTRYEGLTEQMLLRGMDEGVVERQDPVRLKHFVSGALRSVLLAALSRPGLDPVADGLFTVEMCLRAMRPVAQPRSVSVPALPRREDSKDGTRTSSRSGSKSRRK